MITTKTISTITCDRCMKVSAPAPEPEWSAYRDDLTQWPEGWTKLDHTDKEEREVIDYCPTCTTEWLAFHNRYKGASK